MSRHTSKIRLVVNPFFEVQRFIYGYKDWRSQDGCRELVEIGLEDY